MNFIKGNFKNPGKGEKMMRKSLIVLLGVAVLGLLVLAGCGQKAAQAPKEAPKEQAKPVKIGALLDFTGPVADLGPKFKAGIELALAEADNKVAGRPVELIVEDSATDVTTALEKFKKLVEKDGVKIVIGPLMGDAHLAIAPYAAEKKVLVTSLINGMYDVIKYKTYLIYPTTVDAQTYPFGQYVYDKLGYRTMITIGADYAGKRGYVAGAAKGFQDRGGTVVQQLWPPVGTADYSPYISSFKKADVVLYALEGPGPVSRFITQYKQAGLKMPLVTITQDGDYTPEALKELGDLALGIKGESSYVWRRDDPVNNKFVDAIKAKTGKVPSCSEQNAYTLTKVILAGLEKTGGDDNFEKLWPAVTSLKMDTPQGPLSFTPEGVAITDVYVTEAEKVDGQYVLSKPLDVTKAVRDPRLK